MRSVGSHSTSGREKEGKKERRYRRKIYSYTWNNTHVLGIIFFEGHRIIYDAAIRSLLLSSTKLQLLRTGVTLSYDFNLSLEKEQQMSPRTVSVIKKISDIC